MVFCISCSTLSFSSRTEQNRTEQSLLVGKSTFTRSLTSNSNLSYSQVTSPSMKRDVASSPFNTNGQSQRYPAHPSELVSVMALSRMEQSIGVSRSEPSLVNGNEAVSRRRGLTRDSRACPGHAGPRARLRTHLQQTNSALSLRHPPSSWHRVRARSAAVRCTLLCITMLSTTPNLH